MSYGWRHSATTCAAPGAWYCPAQGERRAPEPASTGPLRRRTRPDPWPASRVAPFPGCPACGWRASAAAFTAPSACPARAYGSRVDSRLCSPGVETFEGRSPMEPHNARSRPPGARGCILLLGRVAISWYACRAGSYRQDGEHLKKMLIAAMFLGTVAVAGGGPA